MRRLGPTAAAFVLVATLVSVVPARADPQTGTSTQGYPIFTVPGTESGRASVINDDNWVGLNGAIPWIAYDPSISPLLRSSGGALIWRGGGSPEPIAAEFMLIQQQAHHDFVIRDMNESGEVVGDYVRSSGVFPTAFRWDASSGFAQFGTPGTLGKNVTGIDDSGQVTGWYNDASGTSSPCGGITCSFVGTPGSISTITEASFQAFDIDDGLVVGSKTWSVSTGVIDLLPAPGGTARAVNSLGQLAGSLGDGSGGFHAAFWESRTAQALDLGTLPGDTHSFAWGINDKGWVVGWSGSNDPDVDRRAFIWKGSGSIEPLGTFEGGSTSEAYDINNHDLVVGEADGRPVIWNAGGTGFGINYPPILSPFVTLQATPGEELVYQPTISDPEGDPIDVECEYLPPGAQCDAATGQLTWTPQPSDVDQDFIVRLTVSEVDNASNTSSQLVGISVRDPAFTLDPIDDMVVSIGENLSFQVTSSGVSRPSHRLFSGTPPDLTNAPPGISFNQSTGDFSWTPTAGDEGVYPLTVQLRDLDNPLAGVASESFVITVEQSASDTVTILVDESILVIDDPSILSAVVIEVLESIEVSDVVELRPPISISIVENVTVADDATVMPPLTLTVTEQIAVSDAVAVEPTVFLVITETVSVADSHGVSSPIMISVSETIAVDDAVIVAPGALGSISGLKWEDSDGNGVRSAGEPTIEGVTIYLDLDDDGTLDVGEPWTATGLDGAYTFSNLVPGEWVVREIVPSGFVQTFPDDASEFEHRISLSSGEDIDGTDFGNQQTNQPPILQPIDDVFTVAGSEVVVTPIVADPENDELDFIWDGVPDGAIINGIFEWVPDADQAPGVNEVILTVLEADNPDNAATQPFTIYVAEAVPPTASDGEPTGVPPSAQIGVGFEITGDGFAPGSTVGAYLYSDPVFLGSAPVQEDTSFSLEVTIPEGITPGTHQIVVIGVIDGTARVLSVEFQVTDDADNDGLTGDEEALTGTDPANPDSDGDGLIDGIDASWLIDYLDHIPSSDFKRRIYKPLMKATVVAAAVLVNFGQGDSALSITGSLESTIDGCDTASASPDGSDWIIDCGSQTGFREFLSLYERGVETLPLPDPFPWW